MNWRPLHHPYPPRRSVKKNLGSGGQKKSVRKSVQHFNTCKNILQHFLSVGWLFKKKISFDFISTRKQNIPPSLACSKKNLKNLPSWLVSSSVSRTCLTKCKKLMSFVKSITLANPPGITGFLLLFFFFFFFWKTILMSCEAFDPRAFTVYLQPP
jgi:hypothetical protein